MPRKQFFDARVRRVPLRLSSAQPARVAQVLLVVLCVSTFGCTGSPLADAIATVRSQNANTDTPTTDTPTTNGDVADTTDAPDTTDVPTPVITAFNVQGDAISLEWIIADVLEAEIVSSYIVQRSEQPDTGFSDTRVIARFDQPPFIDNDIRPGTTYFYRVVAVGLGGEQGEPSTTVTVMAPSTPGQIFIAAGDIVGTIDPQILGVSDLNGANPDFADTSVQNVVRAQGQQLWRIGTSRWDPAEVLDEPAILSREVFFGTTIEHARDPQFYNFDYLDRVVANVLGSGGTPIFTIDSMPVSLARNTELDFRAPILSWSDNLRNSPPANAAVFAEVVVHIIAHFRRGFADGLELDLPFWELWNAPDLTLAANGTDGIFWTGTLDEFSDMYAVVHNAVKAEYGDDVSFGGAAFVNPVSVGRFLDRLAIRDVTPDFVSYSVSQDQIAAFEEFASAVQAEVIGRGLDDLNVMIAGWNLSLPRLLLDPDFVFRTPQTKFDAAVHAVQYLAVFQTALDLEIDIALHEGLRDRLTGLNLGLLTTANLRKPVTRLVESLQTFRTHGDRLRLEPDDAIGLAGINEVRTEISVIVANAQNFEQDFSVAVDDLPWDEETGFSWSFAILDDGAFSVSGDFAGDVAGGGSGTRLRVADIVMPPQSIMRLDIVRN